MTDLLSTGGRINGHASLFLVHSHGTLCPVSVEDQDTDDFSHAVSDGDTIDIANAHKLTDAHPF